LARVSGDTGAAVAAAFHGRPGVRVVVLYPDGRVSARQAHQLGAFGDNVTALRVAGSFDDCQRLVKAAFQDPSLVARHGLASANSISLGRLLPQLVYHAAGAARAARAWGVTQVGLVVPTGNLGNGLAALLARAMGAPIGPIALATNANRVVPDWRAGAPVTTRLSIPTLANAMDVGVPSNLERLTHLFPDAQRDATLLADAIDDDAIRARIAGAYARSGQVVCPHTACGLEVAARLAAAGDAHPWVVAATAHPAKFETIVEPLVGRAVPPPPALAALLARPAHAAPMATTEAALVAALG
jgi:threonine synthase